MNEKLQKWALTAEIVGGLAVVVSLAIVAYELNQSTKEARLSTNALEISAYQSLIDSIINLNNLIATDTDLAELRLKSSVSPEDISGVELLKINSFYINVIRHGDMAYFQYERGAIEKERLDSVLRIVWGQLNNPLGMRRWERVKFNLSDSYMNYLDDYFDRQNIRSE